MWRRSIGGRKEIDHLLIITCPPPLYNAQSLCGRARGRGNSVTGSLSPTRSNPIESICEKRSIENRFNQMAPIYWKEIFTTTSRLEIEESFFKIRSPGDWFHLVTSWRSHPQENDTKGCCWIDWESHISIIGLRMWYDSFVKKIEGFLITRSGFGPIRQTEGKWRRIPISGQSLLLYSSSEWSSYTVEEEKWKMGNDPCYYYHDSPRSWITVPRPSLVPRSFF